MNPTFSFTNGNSPPSGKPLLIAGPCVVEGQKTVDYAAQIQEIVSLLPFEWVFKASFDKANRTAASSDRGVGIQEGLAILEQIKKQLGVAVLTDVHLPEQCALAAEVVDILQIPSFLCRQTDLLIAAAETGKTINIKKGQFLAPADRKHAVEKVRSCGNDQVLITERGTTFGYGHLIVDFASLPILKEAKVPVILDATHAVQRPGSGLGTTAGDWTLAPLLLKAGAATGYDGFFVETHPQPLESPSDGPNMIPLEHLTAALQPICQIRAALADGSPCPAL
jgi:2-dehydro-3-deoxyphosphooctonate aldolase (KDO 8-P synthase)